MRKNDPLTVLLRSFLLLSFLLGAGPQVQGQLEAGGQAKQKLQELIELNEVFGQGHTGFALYDLESKTYLYGSNADRRFVPASNIKLLTLFLANRLLGHRVPGLYYQDFGDHLEAWGTGYPLLLHPEFTTYDEVGPWLAAQTRPIVFHFPASPGEEVARYGPGWSWDDYNDGFVYERSALPIYGNRLFLDLSEVDAEGRQLLLGAPTSVVRLMQELPGQEIRIHRSEHGNNFTLAPDFTARSRFPVERPLHLSVPLIRNELAAAFPELGITTGQATYPTAGPSLHQLEVSLPDTVFRRLLQQSDNFLGEQLLIQAASKHYGRPDVGALLAYAVDTLLPAIGIENIRWVDGSGLSRYNLLTPRHFARLVIALEQEIGRDRLLGLLAVGGRSGTLKTRFDNKGQPYVWAKTGTLSGVTCVSGLLLSRSEKWLAFSFMHNNYVGSSSPYYWEMEKALGWVYENM
jgi:D-alanyl-D-alanine carboxypeptidase/D-alanyl-D-alanine-endopeptidase (penicillin-binding protein 4)